MKKVSIFFSTISFWLFFGVQNAFAVTQNLCPPTQFQALCNLKYDNAGKIIGQIIQLVLVIAVVLALLYLLWGGIKWITSGGDKTKLDSARQHVIAAIVGLIIAFLAFLIVSIVGRVFGVNDPTNIIIPQLGH